MPIVDIYSRHSFNKNVVIELGKYSYHHHPLTGKDEEERYIGREGIENQFLQYFDHESPRGAYLVTGYRGMGKTSFVNKVLETYKEKLHPVKKRLERINLNLGRTGLNKEDIFRQIIDCLIDYMEERSKDLRIYHRINPLLLAFHSFLSILSLVLLGGIYPLLTDIYEKWPSHFKGSHTTFGSSSLFNALCWITLALALLVLVVGYIVYVVDLIQRNRREKESPAREPKAPRIYKRLKELQLRSNSSLTTEDNVNSASLFRNFPLSLFSRRSRNYPVMQTKDIENDLIKIIELFSTTELIFVFDELDKVDADTYWSKSAGAAENPTSSQSYNRSREQKETILGILASLKFFMSQTKAKFIFIAGREMFDAALADIADRQNYLGSIFHHVVYVDSFLKDSPRGQNNSLTQRVEDHLEKVLFSGYSAHFTDRYTAAGGEHVFLQRYFLFLRENYVQQGLLTTEEALKVIFSLQTFVIYLAYRSNGSPKKITKIVEEHIVTRKQKSDTEPFRDVMVPYVKPKPWPIPDSQLYLELTYDAQYRNTYISYLFQPFLINYSNYAKRLSDKILVALPFMIDHILKFHDFAFSRHNLELLPEVISPNRTHLVRNLIFDLISYFSENHVKNIEMGLFEYRFNRKTSDELKFISKTFEEESAAFNFSLDEMQSVKTYLYSRIEQLRQTHAVTLRENTDDKTIYSLSFLESLMGDAHYFDKEYDLAVLSYLDSVKTLRNKAKDINTFENHLSVLRLLLKIGLMYELMKKFDMALGYFYDALHYYRDHVKTSIPSLQLSVRGVLMQLFFKTVLSIINMTEKKISNGLTLGHLHEFETFIAENFPFQECKEDDDNPRINLEMAHYYSELGTILFHKNFIPIKSRNALAGHKNNTKILPQNLIFTILFYPARREKMLSYSIDYLDKDYRPTLAPLNEYKQVLLTMLSSAEQSAIRICDPHIRNSDLSLETVRFSTLFYFAARKIRNYKNIYVGNYLQIAANTLSHLGDSLFSLTIKPLNKVEYLAAYARHYFRKERAYEEIKNTPPSRLDQKLQKIRRNFQSSKKSISPFITDECTEIVKLAGSKKRDRLSQLLDLLEPRPLKYWDSIAYDYFELMDKSNSKKEEALMEEFCDMQYIVFVYYLSARYFSKGGLNNSFSHQVKKIFQVVRNKLNRKDTVPDIPRNMHQVVQFFEKTLLKMVLESASRSSFSTDRPQMQKYKYFEGLNKTIANPGNFVYHPEAFMRYNYINLSNAPEVREAILYYAMLKLKTSIYPEIELSMPQERLNPKEASPHQLKTEKDRINSDHRNIYEYLNHKIPELKLINPHNIPCSQYSRILEIDLHCRINYILLKKIMTHYTRLQTWEDVLYRKLKRHPDSVSIPEEVKSSQLHIGIYNFLCELVASSIFLHVQQIKVFGIFQVNPLLNNTLLAKHHMRLGRWLKYYLILSCMSEQFYPGQQYVDKKIDILFGNMFTKISLDSTSQFQIALQLLHKAKQYHSNSEAYKKDMENKVYLEGDYSDITYNFGLALERHKLNSGKIREEIRKLEKELSGSPLLVYDSFTNSAEFPGQDEYLPRDFF